MAVESPFQLFSPTFALRLGIALSVFGVALVGVAASPLGRQSSQGQRFVTAVVFTAVALSSTFTKGWMEASWNWLALVYAVGVPTIIAVAGVQALVAPQRRSRKEP